MPLAKPDADILLDLQPMVEAIYQRSRYERSIDYKQPLTPRLKCNRLQQTVLTAAPFDPLG